MARRPHIRYSRRRRAPLRYWKRRRPPLRYWLPTTPLRYWTWRHPWKCTRKACLQTVYIQRGREHTGTGNWSESGFGSLRGAPLNISRCLGGESTPRPYGPVTRRPAAPRVPLGYCGFVTQSLSGITGLGLTRPVGQQHCSQKQRNTALTLAHAQTILYKQLDHPHKGRGSCSTECVWSAPLGTPRTASRIRGSGRRRRAGLTLLLARESTLEDGLGIIHYCHMRELSQTVYIQKRHAHTRTGNGSESGFGSLRDSLE